MAFFFLLFSCNFKFCVNNFFASIFNYQCNKAEKETGVLRSDVLDEFEAVIKSIDNIRSFCGEYLPDVSNKSDVKSVAYFRLYRYADKKFDLEKFHKTLVDTYLAMNDARENIKKSIHYFNKEEKEDRGGKDQNILLNVLLLIWKKKKPRSKSDEFICFVNNKLPTVLQFSVPSPEALKTEFRPKPRATKNSKG